MSKQSKPILFSTPMIQALLDGRKTQTRRVVKVQPTQPDMKMYECVASTDRQKEGKCHYAKLASNGYSYDKQDNGYFKCPYGNVGDLLWVRETFSYHRPYVADNISECLGQQIANADAGVHYWADGYVEWGDWYSPKPSIHMPKWASRLTLEIINIRVERLQDISAHDAMQEGIDITPPTMAYGDIPIPLHYNQMNDEEKEKVAHEAARHSYMARCADAENQIEGYKELWQSLNGKDSWHQNPWVWVIEFKVHKCNFMELMNNG